MSRSYKIQTFKLHQDFEGLFKGYGDVSVLFFITFLKYQRLINISKTFFSHSPIQMR